MKILQIIGFVFFVTLLASCTKSEKSLLQGTWNLESYELTSDQVATFVNGDQESESNKTTAKEMDVQWTFDGELIVSEGTMSVETIIEKDNETTISNIIQEMEFESDYAYDENKLIMNQFSKDEVYEIEKLTDNELVLNLPLYQTYSIGPIIVVVDTYVKYTFSK